MSRFFPRGTLGRAPACARICLSLFGLALVLGAGLVLTGCSGSKKDHAAEAATPKRYPIRGVIVSVDLKNHAVLLNHQAIPGYMPAMTMEYGMSPGDLANAKAGQRIRAMMNPDAKGLPQLEDVWPDDQAGDKAIGQGERSLRDNTVSRGTGAYRELGEKMPGFVLYNQDGKVVTAADFKGKMVMIDFIYTRCPIANMCPLETSKMVQTQQLAKKAGVKNVEFISITLDPKNDTPGVLKEYAKDRSIDTSNFSFLTGPEQAVNDLLTQFGVLAQLKGGIIQHTLATLLISPNGTIAYRADGSDWEPKDFVDRMKL